MGLGKAGGNWVSGDRFFNREAELEALTERVHDGTHTLLTARGKCSARRKKANSVRTGCADKGFPEL